MAKQSTNPNQRHGSEIDREGFTQVKIGEEAKEEVHPRQRKAMRVRTPAPSIPLTFWERRDVKQEPLRLRAIRTNKPEQSRIRRRKRSFKHRWKVLKRTELKKWSWGS